MFVRKKLNKSGSLSIQIISKNNGVYQVRQSLGSSKDPDEIAKLIAKGKELIKSKWGKQPKLFATKSKEELAVENFLDRLSNAQIRTIGPELIFGTLFDRLGFNSIPDELFRHLVIARLAYPASKLKTVDYLYRYRGLTVQIQTLYRFLDKLSSRYQQDVEDITFKHTKRILKGNISIIFYDLTTLYFEAENEDDLRKIGFSKDGKFHKPQIMLGLLVGEKGYPISYDIFQGNTFEGHTLLPTLKKIQGRYGFKKPIIVADSALLSKANMKALKKEKYYFIIGARIKNESRELKEKILKAAVEMTSGDSVVLNKQDRMRLVVIYSHQRAKKDQYNRQRGLRRLQNRIRSGQLTKAQINNRGYNKFLKLRGKVSVEIDQGKITADSQWDGLKGYLTNTRRLPPSKVVEHYSQLWQIEKAFRISKTDLKIRPIYHYQQRRIKAHICIAFVAYTIYKELERLLHKSNAGISTKRAAELTHTMYELEYMPAHSAETKTVVLKMDQEQQILYDTICK